MSFFFAAMLFWVKYLQIGKLHYYVLTVGAQGQGADAAVASALLAVADGGIEILWRTRA